MIVFIPQARARRWAAAMVTAIGASGCASAGEREGAPAADVVASSQQAVEPKQAWTATGSMSVARQAVTATRLSDGRVLIAGGTRPGSVDVGDVYFETAEIFN